MSESVSIPPSAPATPADRKQFWRETIAAFNTSGLSVRAFCHQRGLHEKRFYTWRRNLGLSPVAHPTPSTPAPGFVPVRLVSDPTAEIVLPGGVTLRLPLSAEASHVARLVAVLRGGSC